MAAFLCFLIRNTYSDLVEIFESECVLVLCVLQFVSASYTLIYFSLFKQ